MKFLARGLPVASLNPGQLRVRDSDFLFDVCVVGFFKRKCACGLEFRGFRFRVWDVGFKPRVFCVGRRSLSLQNQDDLNLKADSKAV